MKGSIVYISVFLLLMVMIVGCVEDEEKWGEEGDLSLNININPNSIEINQPIEVNLTFSNVGTTSLRIFLPWWFVPPNLVIITDENGSKVHTRVEWEPPPDATDEDLIILEPGESASRKIEISNEIYNLEENMTYHIQGKYTVGDRPTISKPYWKGEIYTSKIEFDVVS